MPDDAYDADDATAADAATAAASRTWTTPAAPSVDVEGPLSASLFAPEQPSAVVLLHSLGLDRTIWSPIVDPLAATMQVLLCDLPGHGGSPAVPDVTVEVMADQVAATVEAAGLPKVSLVGMSLGGSVAQAVAVRHPGIVRSLSLVDTTAWYGPEAVVAWSERASRARCEGLAPLARSHLDRWFSEEFCRRRPDVCGATMRLFCAANLDGYVNACGALGVMDLRSVIGAVRCPTVVIVGEHDQATPWEAAREIAQRIDGSTVHVVPGAKHLTAVERPAAVLALAASVLDV